MKALVLKRAFSISFDTNWALLWERFCNNAHDAKLKAMVQPMHELNVMQQHIKSQIGNCDTWLWYLVYELWYMAVNRILSRNVWHPWQDIWNRMGYSDIAAGYILILMKVDMLNNPHIFSFLTQRHFLQLHGHGSMRVSAAWSEHKL